MNTTALAIIVPGVVSALTIVCSFLHNRAILAAERRKLLYKDRIDALAAILEPMIKFNRSIDNLHKFGNRVGLDKLFELVFERIDDSSNSQMHSYIAGLLAQATEVASEFRVAYQKHLIFIPPEVSKSADEYVLHVVDTLPEPISSAELRTYLSDVAPTTERYLRRVVAASQAFMRLNE